MRASGAPLDIFTEAYSQVSGLGRTVRGPSMSATPGKVLVDGTATINGEEVFVLKFLQARDVDLVGKTFFAKYDTSATWLDDLEPAFGEEKFLFEEEAEPVPERKSRWISRSGLFSLRA